MSMTLEKAIEILSDSANRGITTYNQDYKDACNLGIQALIRIKYLSSQNPSFLLKPLPGETRGDNHESLH